MWRSVYPNARCEAAPDEAALLLSRLLLSRLLLNRLHRSGVTLLSIGTADYSAARAANDPDALRRALRREGEPLLDGQPNAALLAFLETTTLACRRVGNPELVRLDKLLVRDQRRASVYEGWVETVIIPDQISRGTVVTATFVNEAHPNFYFWMRRSESEQQRAQLCTATYEYLT